MYTYTFPHEHLGTITNHMTGLQIVVTSMILNGWIYTMVCQTQVDADQYAHLNQHCSLVEVV